MKSKQLLVKGTLQESAFAELKAINPQVAFVFGGPKHFEQGAASKISSFLPNTMVIGCSTAGEISRQGVSDDGLVVTAAHFNNPNFKSASVPIEKMEGSREAGKQLANKLKGDGLTAIFLLSRGLEVNGSDLIMGIQDVLGKKIPVTGGLAGDNGAFAKTFTLLGSECRSDRVVAFGVYGNTVKVGFGSMGGWETFGPVRKVTKSEGNVLYSLDGEPALDLYKKYLGAHAKDLPGSGLLYPFALLRDNQAETGIIRTILAVDEAKKSLTFAGDIPNNTLVRLMHAKPAELASGAKGAADMTLKSVAGKAGGLGILVSCVGRKLVMGPNVEDELDAVHESLKLDATTGFYSYGEICPDGFSECKLHNQTMTITYFND